ncbi:HesA/MoeB/ThiF family protein [Mammaliicoccus sciuri]|uniref:HesA/MoeB/ThiF family protein n=1 Tax=Mammaliicoccus sciuri TaxID=1296 RepID=UPI0034DDA698
MEKLKFNPFCEVEYNENFICFNDYKKQKIIKIKRNELIIRVVKEIDDNLTSEELYNQLNESKSLNYNDYLKVLNFLIEKNIVYYDETPIIYNDDRYSRQMEFWESFFQIEEVKKFQADLTNKHLVIVGAGGLGTWMSLYLTQLGFKKLTIIDKDKIELSNLSRQVLFDTSDIGMFKVEVLKKKLEVINTDVTISIKKKYLDKDCKILKEIFEKEHFDMIVNCADEPSVVEISRWIDNYCQNNNIPFLVGGGYAGHASKLGTIIIPGKTPTWLDYISMTEKIKINEGYKLLKEASNKSKGVINLTASLTAIIQTMDIIKYFSNIKDPLMSSRTAELKIDNLEIDYTYFERNEEI